MEVSAQRLKNQFVTNRNTGPCNAISGGAIIGALYPVWCLMELQIRHRQ